MTEIKNIKQSESFQDRESKLVRELLVRQNEMLGNSLLNLDRLLYLHKAISLMDFQAIRKILVEKLPFILSIRYFTIFLYDKNKKELKLTCHNHPNLTDGLSFHVNESKVMKEALTQGRYILETDFTRSKYYTGKANALFTNKFFVCVPLMIENEIIGVMNLNDNDVGAFSVGDLDFILNVAEFISLSISNALLYEKTETLSITDGLTGLNNRQKMHTALESEFARRKRYKSPLSLALIDLDHFKQVNDTYGHQMGDAVLIELASIIKRICRSNDTPSRYGGEEFVLILPETGVDGAFQIAERIRKEFSKLRFKKDGEEFGVTLSCGVAGLNDKDISSPDQLIQFADQALYLAKEKGRDRTVEHKRNEAS